MLKHTIASQAYGYAVCFVSIIAFLSSLSDIVSSVMDRMDIAHAKESPSVINQSFEEWRLYDQIYIKEALLPNANLSSSDKSFIPDEQSLKRIYESQKQASLQNRLHTINKEILSSSLAFFASIIIFTLHWIFVRKVVKRMQSGTIEPFSKEQP